MNKRDPLNSPDNNNKIFYIKEGKQVNIGVVGKQANNVVYSNDDYNDRSSEKRLLSEVLNFKENSIVMVNQVHKDSIVNFNNIPNNNEVYFAEADALITSVPNICLVIRTADCVPVFIHDSENGVLGAVHSGWRGCHLSISLKVLKRMEKEYGTRKENVKVFILPSIGPESYTVGHDVADLFEDDISHDSVNIFLNLWKNIEESLTYYGVDPEKIYNTQICTMKNPNDYFSYRNKDKGRNLNFGYLIS